MLRNVHSWYAGGLSKGGGRSSPIRMSLWHFATNFCLCAFKFGPDDDISSILVKGRLECATALAGLANRTTFQEGFIFMNSKHLHCPDSWGNTDYSICLFRLHAAVPLFVSSTVQ